MSMSRQEIDLREKIAEQIEKEFLTEYYQVIGLIRKEIWHGAKCPCSQCQRFEIVTCSNDCSDIRKLLPEELKRLESSLSHDAGDLFYCGYCRGGQNEWHSDEMLFDVENEMAVTPCCHTEATEALKCYCDEDACKAEDDSQAREDRFEYERSQR